MHYLLGDGLLGGDREKPFGGMHGKKNFRRASRGGVYGIRVFAHKLTKQGGEARKQVWGRNGGFWTLPRLTSSFFVLLLARQHAAASNNRRLRLGHRRRQAAHASNLAPRNSKGEYEPYESHAAATARMKSFRGRVIVDKQNISSVNLLAADVFYNWDKRDGQDEEAEAIVDGSGEDAAADAAAAMMDLDAHGGDAEEAAAEEAADEEAADEADTGEMAD